MAQDKEYTSEYGDRFETIHQKGSLQLRIVGVGGDQYTLLFGEKEEMDDLLDFLRAHAAALDPNAVTEGSDGVTEGSDGGVYLGGEFGEDDDEDDDEVSQAAHAARLAADAQARETVHLLSSSYRLEHGDAVAVLGMLEEAAQSL